MNELIATTTQTPIEVLLQVDDDGTVSARNVYKFLELADGQFSRWAKTNIAENSFAIENDDYRGVDINVEGNIVTDYKLKISFAKKLCMLQKNERGEQARDYFIKVEDKLREIAINTTQLSPELQIAYQMFKALSQTQEEMKELKAETAEVKQVLTVIQDTIIQRDDDWRRALNVMFNNIVEHSESKDFKKARNYTYEELEKRAHCRLGVKLNNLKQRLNDSGATKTAVNEANKLDVIEADPRLKEIYTSIVKELSVRYAVVKSAVPEAN